MKTWDDWSDFEINKSLFHFTRDFGKCEDIMQKNNPNRSAVMWGDGANWFEFNGCNNPLDMWPIILENNIVITPCMGLNIGDATCYSEHKNPVISEFNDNSKALRAAAIVFLMMNGVNPE